MGGNNCQLPHLMVKLSIDEKELPITG
jgi:hypothetical protein